jgi:hypothetical protein
MGAHAIAGCLLTPIGWPSNKSIGCDAGHGARDMYGCLASTVRAPKDAPFRSTPFPAASKVALRNLHFFIHFSLVDFLILSADNANQPRDYCANEDFFILSRTIHTQFAPLPAKQHVTRKMN